MKCKDSFKPHLKRIVGWQDRNRAHNAGPLKYRKQGVIGIAGLAATQKLLALQRCTSGIKRSAEPLESFRLLKL